MRKGFILLPFAALAVSAAAARADVIDFGQFGPDATYYPGPVSGLTNNGVPITITAPTGDLEVRVQGADWTGQFAPGAPLLFDAFPGAVDIGFATPETSLANIAVQANAFGPYTATLKIYDGATLLATQSYSSDNLPAGAPGTIASFSYNGAAFDQAVFSVTNDFGGLGLGNATAPGPAPGQGLASGLLVLGVGGLRVAVRRKRNPLLALARAD